MTSRLGMRMSLAFFTVYAVTMCQNCVSQADGSMIYQDHGCIFRVIIGTVGSLKSFTESIFRSSEQHHTVQYNVSKQNFFVYFLGRLESVGHSFACLAHYVFFRDVWIRTQRAVVASRRCHLSHPSPSLSHPYP